MFQMSSLKINGKSKPGGAFTGNNKVTENVVLFCH
jgi:hypothetical protein